MSKKPQSKEVETSDRKYDKGSRFLELSVALNDEFDMLKKFGNFDKAYFHNYFHSFYSLAVAFGAKILSEEETDFSQFKFEDTDLTGGTKGIRSIHTDQLEHHDELFKAIAYWYLLKKGDQQPYIILCQPNKARQICEGIFIRYWQRFRDSLRRFRTSYPNVEIADLLDSKV